MYQNHVCHNKEVRVPSFDSESVGMEKEGRLRSFIGVRLQRDLVGRLRCLSSPLPPRTPEVSRLLPVSLGGKTFVVYEGSPPTTPLLTPDCPPSSGTRGFVSCRP